MLAVNGRIEVHPWTDRDGNNRESVEIVAETAYFCGDKAVSAGIPAAGRQNDGGRDVYDGLPDMAA